MTVSPSPVTVDSLGRPLRDLRISVIDNCNFRCTYCMPSHEKYRFLKQSQWLTFAEITAIGALFLNAGVEKFRLTGGEPLLRPNLPDLVYSLAGLGVKDLSVTTNGYLLKPLLEPLFQAGLKRLTVSMDSVHEETFARMSGGQYKVSRVMDSLVKAKDLGFESIKVNCVVQRGVNDHEIEDLITFCCQHGLIPRFIEFMDVGNKNHWEAEEVVPSREILARLRQKHKVDALDGNYFGKSLPGIFWMIPTKSGSFHRYRNPSAVRVPEPVFPLTVKSIPVCFPEKGLT